MKVRVDEDFRKPGEYESIRDAAERILDGADFDNGVLEDVQDRASNNSQAIGRLLDVLVRRQSLDEVDVEEVLGIFGSVTFLGEGE